MTFKHLEDKLEVEQYETYLDIVNRLKEPFNSTLKYMLDMAAVLDQVKLKDEYAIFGGYGVLTHIVDQFGDRIIPTWRGSQDIDMIGDEKVKSTLKGFYNIESDMASPNIRNKRTLKIVEEGRECKVDFTLGNVKEGQYEIEEKIILGIPIMVVSPYDLIKSKVLLSDKELIHKIDVLKLLGVLEHRQKSIKDLVAELNEHQRENLYKILENGKGVTENMRMNLGPSNDYARSLKTYLNKVIMH